MKRAIAWFARNPVAANLLMVFVLASGFLSLGQLRYEIFPDIRPQIITIAVVYLGAAPEEVEEGVCIRVEESIQDLAGIKRVSSIASEGVGTVLVEVEEGEDIRRLLDEVKARVDAIDTFPEETEQPIIQELVARFQVLNVAISGQVDEWTLKQLGQEVREDLLAIPGITQVELAASRPYEISIEVSEDALRRYGLTFDDVVQAVRRSSFDLPGGSIKTEGGEILLRTKGQAYQGRQFEELILVARPDGTRLSLGDVATVVDGFAATDQAARFDGEPAVLLQIFRVGEQSALVIADQVKEYVQKARARLPSGVRITTWADESVMLKDRLSLLLRNAGAGLVLVLLVLTLFLKLRLAGWVSAGIAISFLGAIWLMPILDVSVNLMSLFAFIVALGIVVDDAIVVGENIYRHHEAGLKGVQAAITGAQEVAIPVTFSILTTLAAFYPLLNIPGVMGKFIVVIPILVISILCFSLLESLFVLPAHLSHLDRPAAWSALGRKEGPGVGKAKPPGLFARALQALVERLYRPALDWALEWRYLTAATALSLLVFVVGLVASGWIKQVFLPVVESDNAVALLTMPEGTPVEVTSEAVRQLEQSALELRDELTAEGQINVFRHVLTSIGEQPFLVRQNRGPNVEVLVGGGGAHLGEVNIELSPAEERSISSTEIVHRWRELGGFIPDAIELTFSAELMSAGDAINVELRSRDLSELRQVAEALKKDLARYPGVLDVADSLRSGKKEIQLSLTPQAEALGLNLSNLARQVRQGFYGEEAQRIQRGRDDVRVMIRYPEAERRTLASLEQMRIRTPGGAEVPFAFAGTAQQGRGFAAIRRSDRQRTVNVTADVDTSQGNANEIMRDVRRHVLPELLAQHPGVRYTLEGAQKEQEQMMSGMGRGFLLALLMIYGLLAIPFRSYVQPMIVMSAIPFGFIGAILGHLLMGLELTMLSLFGVVALTGVVVNDSLILVDFINRAHRAGTPLDKALREAGVTRFRPILLTSLTTFAGLTPILLERSLQAQFLIPMAVSLGFGVLFATVITLILVPVLYRILEDVRVWLQGRGRVNKEAVA